MPFKKNVSLLMDFSKVVGQEHLISHLETTLQRGRVAHAQLWVGQSGSGLLPLALAYANRLLSAHLEQSSSTYLQAVQRVANLNHPDLHFVYPVNTNQNIKKNPTANQFSEEWRQFVSNNPYGSLFQWFQHLGIEHKQGNISVREAEDMSKKLSLKSYEGGYKVMIIWMAEKMNTECANKILKLVEEPPQKTVLLLLTEQEEQLLNTITSRCQRLQVPLLSEAAIAKALQTQMYLDENTSIKISRQAHGDYNKALQIHAKSDEALVFEKWFIDWVRTAFKAKGNKKSVQELLFWSSAMAKEGRETQKNFLAYCEELFRQALLKNYQADSLLYLETHDAKFSLEKFAPFIHQNNIFEIVDALEKASYHIERNGNGKIIFSDLSMQLTRLIHRKEAL